MFDKILVSLDGSELSEQALPCAEEVVSRLGSKIILLQVAESTDSGMHHVQELYINQIAQRVTETVKKTRPEGVEIEPVIILGSPADEIIKYADKNDIGLVVMGTHGRSGISRWALGSVANKVVRGSKSPVMLVRSKGACPTAQKRLLTRVLVPLDGSEIGEAALPYATEIASKLGMEMVLFECVPLAYHLYSSGEIVSQIPYTQQEMEPLLAGAKTYLERVAEQAKAKNIKYRIEVRSGAPAEAIVKASDELAVDLVAMSTHGRSGLSRWVFGSVAEHVLEGGSTPLLLIRAPGARGEA